jgi:hypothetical protein
LPESLPAFLGRKVMFQMTERIASMTAAMKAIIDQYPKGHQFFGNELKQDIVRIYPNAREMYVDTILRMARRHRRDVFRIKDRNRSLYEKI